MSPASELARERRRQLGWGLACPPLAPGSDLARDLEFVAGPDGRDLAVVEGPANLAQTLELALTTPLGEDVFNIEFGFDGMRVLAEETNPALVRERLRIAVVQTVRRDPRVLRILEVTADDRADNLRQLTVRVAVETVAAERLTVTMGGTGD